MGTRSLIHFQETLASAVLATLYVQYDGYPTGVGAKIKEVLAERTVVNGYSDAEAQINGYSCAAPMLISGMKQGKCGGVYMYEPGASGMGEEFVYTLGKQADIPDPEKPFGGTVGQLTIKCEVTSFGEGENRVLYDGLLTDFDPDAAEAILHGDEG